MECQVERKAHFRHLLLFIFNRDGNNANAAKARRDICAVYGENALSERTAQWWFSRFKNGHFNLNDEERSGRPIKLDEDRLNDLLHENPRQSTRELAVQLACDQKTVVNHLHSMGKVQKLGAWVPHALSESNKLQRSTIAAGLLARHKATRGYKDRFLHRIITGDEKWCVYVNMNHRKQWLSPNKKNTSAIKARTSSTKDDAVCVVGL